MENNKQDGLDKYIDDNTNSIRKADAPVTQNFGNSNDGLSIDHRDKGLIPSRNQIPTTSSNIFAPKETKEANRKIREAQLTVVDTHLQLLRNQCDAALREDKAFWQGKSQEVATRINAYVSSSLQNIEADRSSATIRVVERIRNTANDALNRVYNDDNLAEIIKQGMVNDIIEEMTASVERVRKQDLTQDS